MRTDLVPARLDRETLRAARQDANEALALLERWSDQIDLKLTAMLGVGALLLGVIPAMTEQPRSLRGLIAIGVALFAWLILGGKAIFGLGAPPGGWFGRGSSWRMGGSSWTRTPTSSIA